MTVRSSLPCIIFVAAVFAACAPIEYSVVIVQASQAISEAEVSGAACTQPQLDALSPVTRANATQSGMELALSEEPVDELQDSTPMCNAPYEYYSALEYLSKAREEVGYSDYQAAVEYARQSREFAFKARDISLNMAKERGR